MKKYDHKKVEKKWQQAWEENNVFDLDRKKGNGKENYYILDMFPYPSGDGLHMGHTESYTASDIYYRYKKMSGFNVLHPQGFDSFGLPAENFAIKTGIHPAESTKKNMDTYLGQWKSLGLGHDFKNLCATSDPNFYKWTQWLFGQFFENNLVYRDTQTVNWDPVDNTILANEQVLADGTAERSGAVVEQREIPGWYFRITDFADDLIEGLDRVDWPESTKKKQINWIGKSEGAHLTFDVKDSEEKIKVFTTRPDTLFGATYMVLAPENELVQKLNPENTDEVNLYIEETKKKSELDRLEGKTKTGVKLEGVFAINPANNEEIPVFISDYVLSGYGTGAVMAVPAHDERDFEFATKFGLEIKQVIQNIFSKNKNIIFERDATYALVKYKDKYLIQHFKKRDFYWLPGGGVEDGENIEDGLIRELKEELPYENFKIETKNPFRSAIDFKAKTNDAFGRNNGHFYIVELENLDESPRSLSDSEIEEDIELLWLTKKELEGLAQTNMVGRTEMIHDVFYSLVEQKVNAEKGFLINSGEFDGMSSEEAKKAITEKVGGEITSNYRLRDWSISRQRYWGTPIPIVYSPEDEAKFVGDENLPWELPTDVDFVPTGTAPLADSEELKKRVTNIFGEGWTPEVDTMDTFVDSSWYFLRYADPNNDKEFCSKEMLEKWMPNGVDLYIGGAEHTYMHLLYARFFTHAMKKMGLISFDEPFLKLRHQGMVNDKDNVKMSKSKGNVINPNEMVERFGADAVRTYMMFASPLEDDVIWNEDNIVGVYRFLEKVFYLKDKVVSEEVESVKKELHKTIKKVTEQIDGLKYNTAVSDMMKFVNFATKEGSVNENDYKDFLKLLSPFAPHITDELSEEILINSDWPSFEEELTKDDEVTIGVQINGKRRGDVFISVDESEDSVMEKVKEDSNINKWLEDADIVKVIYVPGKILNIVVK